jgi:hypothetical protein
MDLILDEVMECLRSSNRPCMATNHRLQELDINSIL